MKTTIAGLLMSILVAILIALACTERQPLFDLDCEEHGGHVLRVGAQGSGGFCQAPDGRIISSSK